MAKWKTDEFHVGSSTVGTSGLTGTFELGSGEASYSQDLSKFVRDAELEKERQQILTPTKSGYRKFATIPDAVAIKIKEEYGLDLHDPLFMHDKDKVNRLKAIMASDYSKLIVNT